MAPHAMVIKDEWEQRTGNDGTTTADECENAGASSRGLTMMTPSASSRMVPTFMNVLMKSRGG